MDDNHDRTPPLTVIYNDTCPICAREVAGYRRLARRHGTGVAFVGLSEGGLDRYGLTTDSAARRFHVIRDGQRLDGLTAFTALWRETPRFRWLAWLAERPVIRPLAAGLYDRALAPALYALHRRRQRGS